MFNLVIRDYNLTFQLELRVQATIGKPTLSPFHIKHGHTEKLNIADRLELCEDAMRNLEFKVKMMTDLGNLILENLQQHPQPHPRPTPQFLTVPTLNDQQPHPPKPKQDLKRRVFFRENSIG